jgi:hypothetical protein
MENAESVGPKQLKESRNKIAWLLIAGLFLLECVLKVM